MHKSQLYFGTLVGLLVMSIGWILALVGIDAAALMVVGLVVVLANVGYVLMKRAPQKIRLPLSERRDRSKRGKH
ncbi:hypothetical protein MJO52_17755 [Microbulbifer variabilis]|uniref:Uncharacterized protein n=1 Tax=Microbulbifer variabilis TaxID=266805 RepID=A0ABY4VAB5_9GAMM|nr:hypothetical protein [Microbulbifer variabilis]USD20885.1 hypothetical protein MJO52_17755 [Microbulbifer variabilis]